MHPRGVRECTPLFFFWKVAIVKQPNQQSYQWTGLTIIGKWAHSIHMSCECARFSDSNIYGRKLLLSLRKCQSIQVLDHFKFFSVKSWNYLATIQAYATIKTWTMIQGNPLIQDTRKDTRTSLYTRYKEIFCPIKRFLLRAIFNVAQIQKMVQDRQTSNICHNFHNQQCFF